MVAWKTGKSNVTVITFIIREDPFQLWSSTDSFHEREGVLCRDRHHSSSKLGQIGMIVYPFFIHLIAISTKIQASPISEEPEYISDGQRKRPHWADDASLPVPTTNQPRPTTDLSSSSSSSSSMTPMEHLMDWTRSFPNELTPTTLWHFRNQKCSQCMQICPGYVFDVRDQVFPHIHIHTHSPFIT